VLNDVKYESCVIFQYWFGKCGLEYRRGAANCSSEMRFHTYMNEFSCDLRIFRIWKGQNPNSKKTYVFCFWPLKDKISSHSYKKA
jgi:hypothetical protein